MTEVIGTGNWRVLVAVIKDNEVIHHTSTVEQAIMFVIDTKLRS